MALSYNEYTADGTQTLFASKPYLQEGHLVVAVGGVIQAPSAYTVSGTAVTFNTAPANLSRVRVGRNTSQSLRLTDYSDASLLTADVLDADANQLFFMTQEAIDTASETNLAGVTFYNSSATAPAAPVVGDLWYDTYNKYLKVYNGTEWQLATPSNETLTFETFFTEGSYSYINVAGLNKDVFVFLNGVKQVKDLDKANLLATTGAKDFFLDLTNSRVYFKTLASSDVVQVILAPSNIGNNQSTQLESFTATAGQTIFNLVKPFVPAANTLHVYVNGVRQSAYAETTATRVTFTSGLTLGDEVVFITNQYAQEQSFTAATNVTYTPAGTGAVATTVQKKLRETVSVKDFGAVGDGVTDDTAAISAAIDAGSTIIFPAGIYSVCASGSIVKTSAHNKTLIGLNAALKKAGTKGVFYFKQSSNIVIEGLEFDGDVLVDEAAAGSFLLGTRLPANYSYAVVFEECSRCTFRNNYVHDFSWDGVVSYGIVAAGALSSTYSSSILVENNRIRNVRNSMIWLKSTQNALVQGNYGFNDTGGSAFEQKGNFIFCVEFCDSVTVVNNKAHFIGDNFVGIGDQINDTLQARNTNIVVTDNIFKTCRYHGILIAQLKNGVISNNIIEQAGAKDAMFPSSAVQCAAITMFGGVDGSRTSQPNLNIDISNNVIDNPYEMGIYALDRGLTVKSGGSKGISFSNNKITNVGQLTLATRMIVRGINTQFPNAVEITNNFIDTVAGEGIRVFGDAKIQGNEVYGTTDISIHVPDDTIFSNVSLSFVVADNTCIGSTRSGILIAGRQVTKTRGNKCEGCGIDTAPDPATEAANAYLYSGIGIYNSDHYISEGDETNVNGASGVCFRPSSTSLNKVRVTNLMSSDNGSVFDSSNYRSGVYAEGISTITIEGVYIGCGGYTGTNQQYQIRQVHGGQSVSLDDAFDVHPNGSVGVILKSIYNI